MSTLKSIYRVSSLILILCTLVPGTATAIELEPNGLSANLNIELEPNGLSPHLNIELEPNGLSAHLDSADLNIELEPNGLSAR